MLPPIGLVSCVLGVGVAGHVEGDPLRDDDHAVAVGHDDVPGIHRHAADADRHVAGVVLQPALDHRLATERRPERHPLGDDLVGVADAAVGDVAPHAVAQPRERVGRAHQPGVDAALVYHGEVARLNLPDPRIRADLPVVLADPLPVLPRAQLGHGAGERHVANGPCDAERPRPPHRPDRRRHRAGAVHHHRVHAVANVGDAQVLKRRQELLSPLAAQSHRPFSASRRLDAPKSTTAPA